ncbi:MAG TPA: hypothetical protein VFO35_19575, partial [Steroidobacteraceae bacterium]|nr:hypothetical protein [Steroidobacteraceae bacterium]
SRHCEGNSIFHISASDDRSGGLFESCNATTQSGLRLLPFYDWIRELRRLQEAGSSLPAAPLLEYAFAMDEQSFYAHRNRLLSGVRIDCGRTRRELESAGIATPALNDDLVRVCVEHMLATDTELKGGRGDPL